MLTETNNPFSSAAQAEKAPQSCAGVSFNSPGIFKLARRSMVKSVFTFAFRPPATAQGAYVPTRSQTQQSIWKKSPAKGQKCKYAFEMKQGV